MLAELVLGGLALAGAPREDAGTAATVPLCPAAVEEGWMASEGAAYMRWELVQQFKIGVDQLDAMERLFRAFEAAGLDVVAPLVPPRPLADPGRILVGERAYDRAQVLEQYRALVRWLGGHGIVVVDLAADAMAGWGEEPPFFSRFDDHWTSGGARVAAQRVAQAARGLPALQQGPEVAWKTRLMETLPGQSALFRRCGEGFGETTRYIYGTQRAEPVGLLDELPPPSAVAVGTSQSGPNSNFIGFLREYLSRDVSAYAVPGGGALSGLARWLFTETNPDTRPRLVIWELVMVHLFSIPSDAPAIRQAEFFRELIPAVAGDCGAKALATGTSTGGVLLRVPPAARAQGDGYYLVFTGALPVEFELVLRHADGDDRHRFEAFDRVGPVPTRFLSLDPARTGILSAVRAAAAFPDGITTRLCKG